MIEKARRFYSLSLNSARYSWDIYQENFAKNFRGWALSEQRFCEKFIWTWFCFKWCRVLSLKTTQKRCKPTKICWHSKRQKKNIEKRERKTKYETRSATFFFFLLLQFYAEKNIWINLVFTVAYVLQIFFTWQVIGNAIVKYQRSYRYALVL